jgi:hypothetical protein
VCVSNKPPLQYSDFLVLRQHKFCNNKVSVAGGAMQKVCNIISAQSFVSLRLPSSQAKLITFDFDEQHTASEMVLVTEWSSLSLCHQEKSRWETELFTTLYYMLFANFDCNKKFKTKIM